MKKICKLAACFIAACVIFTACDSSGDADSDVTPVVTYGDDSSDSSSTKTLIDSTFDLSAGYYKAVEFSTNKSATLSESVTVNSSGGTRGVRVFLLDSNNYALFQNQYSSLENAAAGFSYYSSFSASTRTTSYSTSSTISSGTYYLVIYNPNLMYSQNVTVRATLTR